MPSSIPTSILKLQRSDGSFPIRSSTGEEPSDSTIITLHALLLDLLQDHVDMTAAATRLTRYVASLLHMQDFDKTLVRVDTRAIFHALATLYEYDSSLILPDILAKSIAFLTAHEVATGGPYINALSKQKKPDLVTNVSISRFIHAVGGPFPTLMAYIDAASIGEIEENHYFLSTWPLRLQINEMRRAAGVSVDGEYKEKIPSQDSSTVTDWIYQDPWSLSNSLYGMEALTLAKSLPKLTMSVVSSGSSSQSGWQKPHAELVRRAMTYYDNTTASAGIQQILSRISRADRSYEIGLLAVRFASSLQSTPPSKDTLEDLGIANLYNWAAYTIYDDILDGDSERSQLPIANMALRTAVHLFCRAVPTEYYQKVVHETFDAVDAANDWELKHCRFPIYNDTISIGALPNYDNLQNLYGRSLTHCLPIIGTLLAADISPGSDTLTAVTEAFKQYLVVRQLSDDLHDWQEDLGMGRITFVVYSILRHARVTTPKGYSLHALMPRLQQVYFQKTLPVIGKVMLKRSTDAHALLRSAKLPLDTVIDKLINGYEQSTHHMLDEHRRMASFLQAYKP